QIQMSFTNYLICRSHIQSGKLRALAVTTAKRSTAVPELPAIAEVVPGYDADNWYGLIAPAKTPAPLLDTLHRQISAILQTPDIRSSKRRISTSSQHEARDFRLRIRHVPSACRRARASQPDATCTRSASGITPSHTTAACRAGAIG